MLFIRIAARKPTILVFTRTPKLTRKVLQAYYLPLELFLSQQNSYPPPHPTSDLCAKSSVIILYNYQQLVMSYCALAKAAINRFIFFSLANTKLIDFYFLLKLIFLLEQRLI